MSIARDFPWNSSFAWVAESRLRRGGARHVSRPRSQRSGSESGTGRHGALTCRTKMTASAHRKISSSTRALVTGGAGFIGSHLVERLVERGAHVTIVDDGSTGRNENLRLVASAIDFERGQVGEMLKDAGALTSFDVIFHLAGN